MEEGYIKFDIVWEKSPALPSVEIQQLAKGRSLMYAQGLIGAYKNGIGFGNISQRVDNSNSFYITGSATGHVSQLSPKHFTTVIDFDIDQNKVVCRGPIKASSESMSHAVIYQECPEVGGVAHAHHLGLWRSLLGKVPTTDKKAAYGTPEMARSIIELLKKTQLSKEKIFVMEGHVEGIFTFGQSVSEALDLLLFWIKKEGFGG